MSPPPRRIQVCADDFGFDAAVSQGILDCIAAGRVQAAGCMVLAPDWPRWAPALRELRAQADCGLHFDVNEFSEAAPGRSLSGWILAAYRGGIDAEQARIWVARQLDAFERAMQGAPNYLDGHQHVHQLPVLREAVCAELQRRYGHACALRSTATLHWRGFKPAVIQALGSGALRRLARAAGLRMNRDFAGVYDFGAAPDYARRAQEWLGGPSGLVDGGLLMTHPGRDATPLYPDAIRAARVRERDFWLSDTAAELLRAQAIVPGRCTDWPGA